MLQASLRLHRRLCRLRYRCRILPPVPASTLAPVSAPVPVSAPEAEQAPGTTHGAPYNPANPQAGGVKPDRKNEAKAFFAWLVSALKRPSGLYVTHSW